MLRDVLVFEVRGNRTVTLTRVGVTLDQLVEFDGVDCVVTFNKPFFEVVNVPINNSCNKNWLCSYGISLYAFKITE